MSTPVTIVLLGEPVAWARARPRFKTPGVFITPAKQRNNAAALLLAASDAMEGRDPFDCAVRVDLTVVFAIPSGWSKKKQHQALVGEIRPAKKPDLSNVAKQVEDAFNNLVYRDDAQIVEYGTLRKVYGSQPKVVVTVSPIGIAPNKPSPLIPGIADMKNDTLDDMIDGGAR